MEHVTRRRIVIWSPPFELGGNHRKRTRALLLEGWRMFGEAGVDLAKRRSITEERSANPELLAVAKQWLKDFHDRNKNPTWLSILVITDPSWQDDRARFSESFQAFAEGLHRDPDGEFKYLIVQQELICPHCVGPHGVN